MTWIRTIPLSEADDKLKAAMEDQRHLYPIEYATPVHPTDEGTAGIVASHTLIPEALFHAFSTFGALMSPDLPLERRQHEMIATVVSETNRCVY
ncbi:MAG TPA: hypothetical protein VG778_11365 [Blastocatellia bacterium]|nr:hypothetical protein [Blastocatellia bacterium]